MKKADELQIVADRAKICVAVESMAMLINHLDKEVEFIRSLPSVKSGDIDLQNGAYCAQVAQAIQDGQTKFAPDPLWMILDRINTRRLFFMIWGREVSMSLSPDQIAWWNSREFNNANLVSVLFRLICVDGLTDSLVILNAADGRAVAPIVTGPGLRLVDVFPISGWRVLKVTLYPQMYQFRPSAKEGEPAYIDSYPIATVCCWPQCAIVWVSDPNEGGV